MPGQFYDDPRILFAGYIQGASAAEVSDYDTVSYQAQTVDLILNQAGIHNIGFYHTTYATRDSAGTPTSLTSPSKYGQGQLVADLTSEDVYRALISGNTLTSTQLSAHSTVGCYHDLLTWRNTLPVPDETGTVYYLTYSTIGPPEGTLWSDLTTLVQNEFGHLWCEKGGAICVGPKQNMRGFELTKEPTFYGPQQLSTILNLATELNNDAGLGDQLAYLHFLFGPNPLPQPQDTPSGAVRDLSALLGPPLVCHFSDIPIPDTAPVPPDNAGLLPWVVANWPQDLSIRPLSVDIAENYTEHASLYKLIGTTVTGNNVWSGWWPQSVFVQNQSGNQTMQSLLPAGTWEVQNDFLLADITIGTSDQAKALSWQYLWEMARRLYVDHNKSYTAQITCGPLPWLRLNDLVLVTRQRTKEGPMLAGFPFCVESISHSIDLTAQTWTTQVSGSEVTTWKLGPLVTPPYLAARRSRAATRAGPAGRLRTFRLRTWRCRRGPPCALTAPGRVSQQKEAAKPGER